MGHLIGISIDLHQRVLLKSCQQSGVMRFNTSRLTSSHASAASRRHSSVRSAYDAHEFFNFATLVGFVARVDRMFDTVCPVVSENFLLNASQCRSNGSDLRDDVDAVAVFRDHSGQAAYLTFNAVEAFRARSLDVRSHKAYLPPQGTLCNLILRIFR